VAGLVLLLLALPGPARAAEKLTIILDWFVNPDHAALVVAQEKGYFAARGLDVDLVAPADPNDPPKLLAAGKADIAVSYEPQLHLQLEAGLPLVRIGTLIATPLVTLTALEDGPIKTIADLKGRKIGYSIGGTDETVLRTMLAHSGVALGDVTLVNVNFSLLPALLSKQVDAVIGTYRNFELNQLVIQGHPGRAFYPEEEGVPPYDELILETSKAKLGDPGLRPFLDAVEQATTFILNHPDDAWQLFIKHHKDLDDALNRRAWADTLRRFAHRPAALDTVRYERFAAFLKEGGLIKTIPPLDSYAVEVK
jgi:putative hydroxymethylpyrimidine transport system substrate-binding protein